MPYDLSPTVKSMETQLAANGYFDETMVGEPKGAVLTQGQRFLGSVIPHKWSIAAIMTDGSPVEIHTLIIRVWCDMLAEPLEDYELLTAEVVGRVCNDLLSGITLGGTVRSVDFAGIYGERMGATWGYIDLSGTKYRVVDITVPLIIDDSDNDVGP